MLFSSLGPEMMDLAEAELFDNISASCMTKQTVQARMTELHRIKQDPGQPVQNFLAKLKSKARQCEMKLVCTNVTCQTINFYSDPVILGLLINGVNDTELQQATGHLHIQEGAQQNSCAGSRCFITAQPQP